jgi:hypothetical protein
MGAIRGTIDWRYDEIKNKLNSFVALFLLRFVDVSLPI